MSFDVLEGMIGEFIERTYGCFGNLARPNHTFYSLEMVALSLAPLRAAKARGKKLSARGERFAACAAAHLAYLGFLGFQRRRLESNASVHWAENAEERRMGIFASRMIEDQEVVYGQEFLRDLEVLLDPEDPFPGQGEGGVPLSHELDVSLEYLYLMGVQLMISPRAAGNWSKHPDEKGMQRGLRSLVDDLVVDLHLAPGDRAHERFCAAAVWPAGGWPDNLVMEKNLAQVLRRVHEDEEKGEIFLRALLRAQLTALRHLAARALLVMGQGPRDYEETGLFAAALDSPGSKRAFRMMGELLWRSQDGKERAPVAFVEDSERAWRQKVESGPTPPWMISPALEDPLYRIGRGNLGSADATPEIAHQLLRSYPDEWWSFVILGRALLSTGETVAGARILSRAAAESPGDLTAHETLIEYLLKRKKISEADRLCRHAVELQPWNQRAVQRALDTVVRAYIR